MNYFEILPISARIPVKWVGVNRMDDVWGVWCGCGAGVGVCNGLFHLRAAILGRYPGSISMADLSLINEQRVEDRKLTIIVTAVGIMPCFQSG